MTFEIWTLYVTAIIMLMISPGPSQLLMLANSTAHGFKKSMATAAGDLTANLIQMFIAGLGLTAVVTSSPDALLFIKWAGALFLIWMGYSMVASTKQNGTDDLSDSASVSTAKLWLQGFITSAANPRAIVFFAALFPQFINADHSFWPQFAVLSVTYLCMDLCFLTTYAWLADWLKRNYSGAAQAFIKRVSGALMIGAAILLALKPLGAI